MERYDYDERAEWGLRRYVCRIATTLGLGPESVCCELAGSPNGYLALDGRLPGYPDRDVALIWDDVHGWGLACEGESDRDLVMVCYLGEDVLPEPARVVTFARAALAGYAADDGGPALLDNHGLLARLSSYSFAEQDSA